MWEVLCTLRILRVSSIFRKCEWWYWCGQSKDWKVSPCFFYVTCQLFIDGILYMEIVPRFLPFVIYEFVNAWFLDQCTDFLNWICSLGVLFCSFVCPFIFMYTNVAWYPSENDAINFGKSVHFVEKCCDEKSGCIFVLQCLEDKFGV